MAELRFQYEGTRRLDDGVTVGLAIPGYVFQTTGPNRVKILPDDGSPSVLSRTVNPPDMPVMPTATPGNQKYQTARLDPGGLTFFVSDKEIHAVHAMRNTRGVGGVNLWREL